MAFSSNLILGSEDRKELDRCLFQVEGDPDRASKHKHKVVHFADLVGLHQVQWVQLHPEHHSGHGELIGLMFRAEGGPIGPPSIKAKLIGVADLVGLQQVQWVKLHPELHQGHGELIGITVWAEECPLVKLKYLMIFL